MIVKPEKVNDEFNILFAADVIGYPARPWMDVVEIGASACHELFPNPDRKGKIRHPISMQVSDLSPSHMKENHAAAVRLGSNAFPRADFSFDLHGNRFSGHSLNNTRT
jgi:hypothetical protein